MRFLTKPLKAVLRPLLPVGFVGNYENLRQLRQLGLPANPWCAGRLLKAVNESRFRLWPLSLRDDRGWTLIDVGANVGEFIRSVIQVAEPGGVVAFEPAPSCWDALQPILGNVPNGRLIRAAVGAASGEIELNCAADSRLSSVLPPTAAIKELFTPDYEVVQTIKSSLVRLDDTIAPDAPIGLLKIDVQGYELEVLRGADRVLRQSSAVLIEVNYLQHYERAVSFNEIHGFLSDKGFQLNGVSRPFMHRGQALWADAMYIR